MGNKLYVGNLPYGVRDNDLEQAFSQYGAVTSARVMMERDTGRSKGFGFVEMGSEAEAQAAIQGMNGQPRVAAAWWSTRPAPWNPALLALAALEAVTAMKAVAAMVVATAKVVTVVAAAMVAAVIVMAAADMAVAMAASAAPMVPAPSWRRWPWRLRRRQ